MARRELVPAAAVEAEWSSVLRTVRAGMLAVPSRLSQRLSPAHDVSEIDREVRAALTEIGNREGYTPSVLSKIKRCVDRLRPPHNADVQ
jgi:phage terminase Nu1 subunit (DNA packaging protein)